IVAAEAKDVSGYRRARVGEIVVSRTAIDIFKAVGGGAVVVERDCDRLGGEVERIGAAAAQDLEHARGRGGISRVRDNCIIASAAIKRIDARSPDQRVVAVAAKKRVVASSAFR